MTGKVPPLLQVALIAAAVLAAQWLLLGWSRPAVPALLVGAALALIGSLVPLLATERFVRAGTTVDPRDPTRSEALVTTGIYRFTRNPMYLGFLCWLLALAVVLHSWLGLLGGLLFFERMQRSQIPAEEAALARRFGDAYQDYCRRVRRWC